MTSALVVQCDKCHAVFWEPEPVRVLKARTNCPNDVCHDAEYDSGPCPQCGGRDYQEVGMGEESPAAEQAAELWSRRVRKLQGQCRQDRKDTIDAMHSVAKVTVTDERE